MNQATASVAALETSRDAARAARGVLVAQRQAWNIAYRQDYFDLCILYTGVRGRAESFFWHAAPAAAPAKTSVLAAGDQPVSNQPVGNQPVSNLKVEAGSSATALTPEIPAKAA